MTLLVLPPIPADIETEDVLRAWVLDQGVNWWDFVLTPDYDDWSDDHPASGTKAVAHVDDYIREGHPVHGYDRDILPRGFPPGLWHPDAEFVFESARPALVNGQIGWKALVDPHTHEARIWTFDKSSMAGEPTHNHVMDALGWKIEDDPIYVEGHGYGVNAKIVARRMEHPEDRIRRGFRAATADEVEQARDVVGRNARTLRMWEQTFKMFLPDGTKTLIHVEPYMRQGRLVSGYDRIVEDPKYLWGQQAADHLDALTREWGAGLSDDDHQILDMYRTKQGFEKLNTGLRQGSLDGDVTLPTLMRAGQPVGVMNAATPHGVIETITPETIRVRHGRTVIPYSWDEVWPLPAGTLPISEAVDKLDKIIESSPVSEKPLGLYLYRGIRDQRGLFGEDGPKVGQRIEDSAYVSTTTEFGVADAFAQGMVVGAEPGDDPIVMQIEVPGRVHGAWMNSAVEGSGTYEYVLPRGQEFEVIQAGLERDRTPFVRVRLIKTGTKRLGFGAAMVKADVLPDVAFEAEHPRGFGGRFREKPDIEVADHLRHIAAEFGDPLPTPAVATEKARKATVGQRTADQQSWLMQALKDLPVGSEIEITDSDVALMQIGPEWRGGITSGLAGTYVSRIAEVGEPGVGSTGHGHPRWYKRERVGRMVRQDDGSADVEWTDRFKGAGRMSDQYGYPLKYTDFAFDYRGALLGPLGWDHFHYDEPTIEEIAQTIEAENPLGEFDSRVSWNNESSKAWPDDVARGVKRGEYVRTKRGWEYYASLADMHNEGDEYGSPPTRDGELIGDSLALANLMEQRWRYHLRNRHLYDARNREEEIYQQSLDASYDPKLYYQDDNGPGELYKQQHALIMEAGGLLDQEIAEAFAKGGFPTDHDVAVARSEREKADFEYRRAYTTQWKEAITVAQQVWQERMEALGFKLLDDRTPSSAEIGLGNGQAEPADELFTYGAVEWRLEHLIADIIDRRNRNKIFQDGETGWATEFQHLRENDVPEFRKRLKMAAHEMAEIMDKRIASEMYRKDLVAPVRHAHADLQEADSELGFVRTGAKKKYSVIKDVLARHRSVGQQTLKVRNKRLTKGIRQVIDSAGYLPTDWIETSNSAPPPAVYTFKGKRAKYLPTDGEIRTNGVLGTSLHELVHHMERVRPSLDAAQWVFWQRRVRGSDWSKEQPTPTWIGYGKKDEVGVRDEFRSYYSGKVYGDGRPGAHWEILTMGIPSLFGLSDTKVVWDDDDYRKFVLGVLALG